MEIIISVSETLEIPDSEFECRTATGITDLINRCVAERLKETASAAWAFATSENSKALAA
jgi:hypothetical protein